MEGTLSSDSDEKDAGVIPRCVHVIFERLQKNFSEYSVKVSFLELYNEELSDLLTEDDRQLRIFEDSTGKNGVMVNGLEEIIVTSPEQVHTLKKERMKEKNLRWECCVLRRVCCCLLCARKSSIIIILARLEYRH